ncbi:MerR family transcriptional regulator [Pseudonocardia acaciae]|uniref:MerR family transcriptional regulator n=1 Tax=Pseudonocardia acaciae TaxID=551276 RepID=UPI00048A8FF8|nr:MerR family transcriptional regulator [Pseudonocardia acaciae]
MSGVTLGIGELARLAGVPVRTVRFYADEGLLPSVRSPGGHRRFTADAVDRLILVRRLRGLGLGLAAVAAVASGERSLTDAVTAERAALDVELTALAWRRAALRAVEQARPSERPARLELLSTVRDPGSAHDTLVGFWSRWFAAPPPEDTFDMFVSVSAPRPPANPTPRRVLAFAGMVSLATDPSLAGRLRRRALANRRRLAEAADEGELHAGIGEACELARPLVLAGSRPRPGHALDRFVDAHARAWRATDTAAFRRELYAATAVDRDPRLRRYWRLLGEVTGEPANVGASYYWLLDSLR